MRRFKVTVEYEGTDFAGFQWQAGGQRSIQGDLEEALAKLTGSTIRVHGAGRTDAGVHALGQVISFDADTRIPTDKLTVAMNSVLRSDVRATRASEVDSDFHARYSAISRSYCYVALNRTSPSAVFGRFSAHVPYALDVEQMQCGADALVGVHDFAAWANGPQETASTVREITRCRVRRVNSFVLVQVEANAFLRGMVRNIVGTLLEVGGGKRLPGEIAAITETRSRANAGPTALARGLCLLKVKY